jgi:hypothetical protein
VTVARGWAGAGGPAPAAQADVGRAPTWRKGPLPGEVQFSSRSSSMPGTSIRCSATSASLASNGSSSGSTLSSSSSVGGSTSVVVVSRQPGHVRRAVRDLRSRHWVFVPAGNVYADFSTLEQDKGSALLAPLDGTSWSG